MRGITGVRVKEAVEAKYAGAHIGSGLGCLIDLFDCLGPLQVEVEREDDQLDVVSQDFKKDREVRLLGLHGLEGRPDEEHYHHKHYKHDPHQKQNVLPLLVLSFESCPLNSVFLEEENALKLVYSSR